FGLPPGRVQQSFRPHVLGREDRQTDEDQEPSRTGQHQERDTGEEHGEARDGYRDPLAAALDEPTDHLDGDERRVLVPASGGFGYDDLKFGNDLRRVDLF